MTGQSDSDSALLRQMHELNARIDRDPTNKLKIIQQYYQERVAAKDQAGADATLLIRSMLGASEESSDASSRDEVDTQVKSTQPGRRLGYVLAGVTVAALIAIGAGWRLYSQRCPALPVPEPHFVTSDLRSSAPKKNKRVIIFVHGVLGDIDNTWKSPTARGSWPEMVADDPDFVSFDVYVYGYLTPCRGNASNITQIAERFGRQLRDEDFFRDYDEIYFIAHSMGGLITERMLSTFNGQDDMRPYLQHVRATIFLAVPNAGAEIASIAAWVSHNPQFRDMRPSDAQSFLQAIQSDWATVLRQRGPARPFPLTFVAYETQPIAGVAVVPALYTSDLSDETPIAFDYDHSRIVKPQSRKDEVYRWTKARILEASARSASGR